MGSRDLISSCRQNDIIIRSQLKSAQDGILAAQTVSGSQHRTVIHQVQQSATETQERLSTCFTTLDGRTQAIQSDTNTLKRKFEESHEAVASSTELIRSDISQANSSVLEVDKVVRAGMMQNAKRQRILARQQAHSTVQLLERLDQMQTMMADCIRGNPPARTVHPETMKYATENLDRIVMPLMLMKSSLCEAVGRLEGGGETFLSTEEIQLLQSEIDGILAAGHEASAIGLRRRQLTEDDGRVDFVDQTADAGSVRTSKPYDLCSQPLSTEERHQKAAWKRYTHWTFAGMLSIGIQREPGLLPATSSASVTFMPKPELHKLGVSIVLTNELRAAMNPRISRCIRTFNVISSDGPGENPALKAIQKNDVLEMQRLLSAKKISPWDRSRNGDDLLHVYTSLSDV